MNDKSIQTTEQKGHTILDLMENVTWTCHICGAERPDHKISVLKKPLTINRQKVGEQNIRYCNDNIKCVKGARTFTFHKDK